MPTSSTRTPGSIRSVSRMSAHLGLRSFSTADWRLAITRIDDCRLTIGGLAIFIGQSPIANKSVAVKADRRFASFPLTRVPRLSVMPVPRDEWDWILEMGRAQAASTGESPGEAGTGGRSPVSYTHLRA